MAKKHKVNPSRRPATMADVKHAKMEAAARATEKAVAVFMTVAIDKKFIPQNRVQEFWGYISDYFEQIEKGEITVPEIKDALKTEEDIKIGFKVALPGSVRR